MSFLRVIPDYLIFGNVFLGRIVATVTGPNRNPMKTLSKGKQKQY